MTACFDRAPRVWKNQKIFNFYCYIFYETRVMDGLVVPGGIQNEHIETSEEMLNFNITRRITPETEL